MKLHLPIALLTAVICAMSFAQGATPTYKVNNGSAEVIVSGDVTGTQSGLTSAKGFVGPLNASGTADSSTITINAGATAKAVTASGVAGVNITGDKTVNIYGTADNVYGGYADGVNDLKGENTSIYGTNRLMFKAKADENGEYPVISLNVGKTGVVKGSIFGGSWYSSTTIGNVRAYFNTADEFNKAVINDGVFAQNEKVEINIDGGEVASVYGGGYRGSVNNTVTITVNGADSKVGAIYGGAVSENMGTYGYNAFVNSTHIVINDGEVTSSIRGGGYSNKSGAPKNIVKGDTLIEINGGKVDYDVMGGGSDGIVEGNTTIILSGGQIARDVYAGGSSENSTSEVKGTGKVIIKGEGTEVTGTIYGGARGNGSVNGDHILGFDGTNNATIAKFLGKSQGFNAVEFKGTTETVDYDTVAASTTNAFDTLIISGAENETAMLAAEASKTVVTSNENHDYKNITVNEGGQYDITGGTHKVTGPGVNGAEEVIVVNGSMSIAGESTKLQVQGASSQVAIGNGGSLVVSDGAAVDMSAAGTIYMGYSKKETGSIVLKDGASFKGGYNNAWLGGGTVDITNSTMEVSNSESGYNYRTLMGLSGNTLQMNVTATDGGDSTFKSAASQLVLNYNDGTNVELVVSGAGATFEQAGTIVTDKSSYSIGTSGIWEKKTINELVTKEVDGKKVTEVKQVERWCDSETEGYVGSGNGTTDTVTYICAKGTNEFGGTVAAVNDVKATITAKDGGSVVIGSKLTYVGSSYDAQALAGKEINKLATFNVEDSASSMSFQGMEIYTNAQVNNKGGKFSATNVNVRAGGNLTFNVNTASAVMTAEKLTVYTGGTLSFVQPGAAEGTSLAMEAPATTTVTLDSDLVLLAGSTLVLDPGMLVNLGYNNLTIQNGAIIKLSNAATTPLTMTDAVVKALATTLFQTAGTFTALGADGKANADGIAYVEFNGSMVAISSGNGVSNVPEPTTATLSLLALAGLCARRRRK